MALCFSEYSYSGWVSDFTRMSYCLMFQHAASQSIQLGCWSSLKTGTRCNTPVLLCHSVNWYLAEWVQQHIRPRRRRISPTHRVEFPSSRSRRLTSHAAVEFFLRRRRRILCPVFRRNHRIFSVHLLVHWILRKSNTSNNRRCSGITVRITWLFYVTNRPIDEWPCQWCTD